MRAERTRAEEPLIDVGWFMHHFDDVQVVYMDGRTNDESYRRYVDAVAQEIDTRDPAHPLAVLYHVPEPSALTSQRRAMLAEVLAMRKASLTQNTRAYAMATTSMIVRAGVRMLFWLAPPPYPNAVVSTPREGFDFLASRALELDAAAINARYHELLTRVFHQMEAK